MKPKNTAMGGRLGLPLVGTKSIKNLAGKESIPSL